jgi:hypothetical protein
MFLTKAAFLAAGTIGAYVQAVDVVSVAPTPYLLGQNIYGTSSLTYARGTATATGVVGEVGPLGGVYWTPLYDTTGNEVDLGQFDGVIGDGVTSSKAGLQQGIDWGIANKVPAARVPFGNYLVADTIHLGYGAFTVTISLLGSVSTFLAGTNFYSSMTDRPVINVQGNLFPVIRGIGFYGPNTSWIQALTSPYQPTAADWLSPTLAAAGSTPGGLQPNSPLAAITFDAFLGAAPAAPYPYTGPGVAYNRDAGTKATVDNCVFSGFAVACVNQPNGDANGDFLVFTNNYIEFCIFALAIGNSQARQTVILNNQCNWCFTALTNKYFGTGEGTLGGPIETWTIQSCFQLADIFLGGGTAAVNFKNCYGEGSVRIAELTSGTAYISKVSFTDCKFYINDAGGVILPYLIQTNGGFTIDLSGLSIYGNSRVTSLVGPGVPILIMDGANFDCALGIDLAAWGAPEQAAVNFCGGLLLGGPLYGSSTSAGRYTFVTESDVKFPSGRAQLTQNALTMRDSNGRNWDLTRCAPGQIGFTDPGVCASYGPPTWVSDVMSVTFTPNLLNNATLRPQLGWILYSTTLGTIFICTAIGSVDSFGNTPYTFRQHNQLLINPANGAYVSNLLTDFTLADTFVFIPTDRILTRQINWGDFTAGSVDVANVHRGDGYAGDLSSWLSPGDPFDATQYNDAAAPWPYDYGTKILTVTPGSPGSVVLTNPALKTGRFMLMSVEGT